MLANFDYFGIPVQMRVSKDLKHKTNFGGLVTIATTIAMFVYSYFILNQCFSYLNPNIVSQDYVTSQPDDVVFNQQQYTFAMGIQDQSLTHFLDESIYYLDVQLMETTKSYNETTNEYDQNTVTQPIKMERCTKNHFQVQGAQSFFETLNYTNIYCLPLDFQLSLAGQFGAMKYKRLYIQVKSCIQNCSDETIIEQKLNNVAFQLYYVNYIISPANLNNPFTPIAQNTFWQSGYSLFKNINIYFRKNTISTDQGLITQDFQSDYRMMYSLDRETIVTKTDNKMYELYIGLEKNKQSECIRTYMKLLSATSQIGGIFNIFFIIGSIVCFPVQKISLYYRLIDSIFDFKEKREEVQFQFEKDYVVENKVLSNTNYFSNSQHKKYRKSFAHQSRDQVFNKPLKNNQNQTNFISLENSQKQNIFQNIPKKSDSSSKLPHKYLVDNVSEENIQENKTNLKSQKQSQNDQSSKQIQNTKLISKIGDLLSFIFQKSKNIKFNISKMMKSQIKYKTNFKPEYQMIDYSIQYLQQYLDIRNIMKKLQDIEKLKYLLLDENQIKLFESISKPTLYLEDFKNQINELNANKRKQIPDTATEGSFFQQQRNNNVKNQQPFYSIIQIQQKDENQMAKETEQAFKEVYQDKQSISLIDKKLLKMLIPGLIESNENEDLNKSIIDKNITQQPLTLITSPANNNSGENYQKFLFSDEIKSQQIPKNLRLNNSNQDSSAIQSIFSPKMYYEE
ncbi:transmembrane protein, putative (macronuclear) [Tetrahymena thermophila SB210]|uniref:Transmembrane protein, putative n=1 Tax=Tetrahymena thermophila (strain SB210) TaxID=312017 RepID=I7M8U6_TETTS|nr:transmembrane protein, putative [Tetrahymena thermophila SB210]EAR99693.1 transmembrane protein, putative [Tetrahymena thermophila SB210]|eukprot:XP_001019938.1 transmembrane protein, putative [Tetrahymena thermophila SB210]